MTRDSSSAQPRRGLARSLLTRLSLVLCWVRSWATPVAAADEPVSGESPASTAAAPPNQQQCLAAYNAAQRLRKAGALTAAYDQLLICSQASCPDVVKADCVPWLDQTEGSLPSIVVVAKGIDGRDTAEVRVFVDDKLVADRLDGQPIAIDPGSRSIRFQHGTAPAIKRNLVIQVGVKNRRVDVSFAPDEKPVGPEDSGDSKAPAERGEPIVGFVLTGVGVLGLGSFVGFGLVGQAEAHEYDDTCAPTNTCDPGEVSATETKLLVADISLVVGLAAVGVGVGLILYNKLSDPDPAAARLRLDLRPTVGGAAGVLTATF